jgi:hypothetical protein
MHLCSAHIMLGGDTGNVLVRGADNPVSWPEIGLLQFLHGEESVFNITALEAVQTTPAKEKDRLSRIYNPSTVDMIYPGRVPVMEMTMPGTTLPGEHEDAPSGKGHRKPAKTVTVAPVEDDEV